MSGGGGGSNTTQTTSSTNNNQSSANVTVNQTIDTQDVANALQALGASQATQAQLYSYALLQSEAMNAGGLNAVAQSVQALGGTPGMSTLDWIIGIVTILGFLISAKLINLKQLGLSKA